MELLNRWECVIMVSCVEMVKLHVVIYGRRLEEAKCDHRVFGII